jgi:hypothetical protein
MHDEKGRLFAQRVEGLRMRLRSIWTIGLSFAAAGVVSAQNPGPMAPPAMPGPGFFPAAQGPVMGVPSSLVFPDPSPHMPGPSAPYSEKPPRYPVDENGNRAINWFYSQSELLWGWTNGGENVRPIATRGNTLGLGILGEPGTSSLGDIDDFGRANGFRQTIGIWLTPSRKFGFEVGGTVLERRADGFTVASDGSPGSAILSRPFFDATTDAENARLIAYPGAFTGRIDAQSRQRTYGLESTFIFNAIERDGFSLDLLSGFRFLALEEGLTVTDRSKAIGVGLISYNGMLSGPPGAVVIRDRAATANRFYGYSIGLRASGEFSRVSYAVQTKIALGAVRQRQFTEGSTSFLPDGSTVGNVTPTGMLYFPANSGLQNRTKFAVVPELGLKLGYRLTHRISTYMGYDVTFLSDAVRPTDTLSPSINPTRMPSSPTFGVPFGPNVPTGGMRTSDFLLQTFSSGVMVVF